MVRVGILGATGYTALELLKRLHRHPEADVAVVTSRQEGGPHLASVHPSLAGLYDIHLENLGPEAILDRVDCVFSCLPHAASASSVKTLVDGGVKVIDFSADYRLNDVASYEQWYGNTHPDPQRVGDTPYGLPELFGDHLPDAQLIANPGCFPTTAILALAPFIKEGLIDPRDLIVDSKSGVSGAGRNPKLALHYPECNESLAAYNVGRHRHMPEIDQILNRFSGVDVQTVFTPHLVPMDRGILSTIYCRPLAEGFSEEQAFEVLRDFYRAAPFVRVVERLPATKDTVHSNFFDVTARLTRGRLILISCLDNLVKGASGAAVQNFNHLYGFAETTAL